MAAMFVGSSVSFAQESGSSSQFGLVYGYSVPDTSNTKHFGLFGVKGSAFLSPKFSFGGYFLVSDSAGQASSADKFSYSLHGVEAIYHFGGGNGDTFTGVRIGVSKVNQNPDGNDVTYSPYHYGVVSGHDFYLGKYFSVGFEGSYIHLQPGKATGGGTTYERDSFNIINFLVSLQLRL